MSPHLSPITPGAGITASSSTKSAGLACSYCPGHLVPTSTLTGSTQEAMSGFWHCAVCGVRCGKIEETGRAGHDRRD